MKCTPVKLPDGGTAIVCTSGRAQKCRCGATATLLCDGPKRPDSPKRETTCSRPICRGCATTVLGTKGLGRMERGTDDTDLCPECAGIPSHADPRTMSGSVPERRPVPREAGAPGVPRCACGKLGVRKCSAKATRHRPGDGPNGVICVVGLCAEPLCDGCAIGVGPGREVCWAHAPKPR